MATKAVEIDLKKEILEILETLRGGCDFVNVRSSCIEEMLASSMIEFTAEELCRSLNNLLSWGKKIKFEYFEVEENRIIAVLSYPTKEKQ